MTYNKFSAVWHAMPFVEKYYALSSFLQSTRHPVIDRSHELSDDGQAQRQFLCIYLQFQLSHIDIQKDIFMWIEGAVVSSNV
jgi:hypothetical protein